MKLLSFIFLLAGACGVTVGLTKEYVYNSSLLTWQNAQSSCRQYYKDLATITTIEENNRLLHSDGDTYERWIGLNKTSGPWGWSDGEPFSFQNWFGGSPFYSYYYCCTYNYQGLWVPYACTDSRKFYCYRYLILVQEMMTWDEAREYCRTKYTGLASVTSETSLQQLNLETPQTQTESVWIGLRFINGIWLWVSGDQLGSVTSVSSCPPPSYHCGSLNNKTNTFENRNCNDRLNFVCYWT